MGLMAAGGSAASAPAGCSASTEEVGDRTQEATSQSISTDYAYVFRVQADCSGNLNTAYIYHNDTNVSSVKIAIYNSTQAALSDEGINATLVEVSSAITTDAATGWKSVAMAGTEPVVAGNWYWIAIFKQLGGNNFITVRNSTATLYYKTTSGYYATPPDPLPAAGWSTAAVAPVSAYVSIGE